MPATTNYNNDDIQNFKAATAMKQGQAVKIAAGETAALCGDGEFANAGICLDSVTAAGDTVGVIDEGKVLVLSGAAFAELAELASDLNGKLITAVATKNVVAIALAAATAADQLVPAKLLRRGQYVK